MFKPVNPKIDFPKLERDLLERWRKKRIVSQYLKKNNSSKERFSFLDGPITANNPMGVHHAWGRTYKDLYQRFWNMRGKKQRFQNGFDEQGLWVEVEVEKELGLKSKKDIENLIPGNKFKSLEKFINLCKERVKKFSAIQTEQSKRLGYFMDWDNSYHTSSDDNNYAIWNFLKIVNEKGWLYKGRDSVPWCPRCGTAISQHEILTEDYKTLIHKSVVIKFPSTDGSYLLAWTTTPWSIPGTIALMVNPTLDYVKVKQENEEYILAEKRLCELKSSYEIVEKFKGKKLIGKTFIHPYKDIEALKGQKFSVIPSEEYVTVDIGTGIVTNNPGVGHEDYLAAKEVKLEPVESIDETAHFLSGFSHLSNKYAKSNDVVKQILEDLREKGFVYDVYDFTHQYPICWRCKTELVFRIVDEWYISMDSPSRNATDGKSTYRKMMVEVAKKINWIPSWGLERELDWLKNMQDWLISKKRYWGLALPIWECNKCGNFDVIGGKEELHKRAVDGWKKFQNNSPHKPWIDEIKIKCSKCQEVSSRITDVGNPWLDAGIVSFSTLPSDFFPADFITESFPGQFKNWFYSLIAMGTALKNSNPFKTVLGFASVRDEKGEEMHKSKGNAIEFNQAASEIGADVMRWLFVTQNPELNLNFGYGPAEEIKRRFYLILWNSYKFFVDYALQEKWKPIKSRENLTVLDKWVLSRLNTLVTIVNNSLEKYDCAKGAKAIENFTVNEFSTWYIRRSRDRVGSLASKQEKNNALQVMYSVMVTLSKLLAPFVPFIAEEIYKNLTGEESVHLTNFPKADNKFIDKKLEEKMGLARKIAELGHAKRKETMIKVRQPLAELTICNSQLTIDDEIIKLIKDELNVKKVSFAKGKGEMSVALDTKLTKELREEGEARDIVREIQKQRKILGTALDEKVNVVLKSWPKEFEEKIKKKAMAENLIKGENFLVTRK